MAGGRDPIGPDETRAAAELAGWVPSSPDEAPPEGHGLPPSDDPALGNNGVPAPQPGDPDWGGVG